MEHNKSKENFTKLDDILTLKDFWGQCINNWKMFFVSIAITLLISVCYIFITPKMYKKNASLLIKQDNKQSTSFINQVSNMGNLDLFGNVSNVENEILCIQSPDVLLEAVKRLNLDYTYSQNKYLTNKALLYGSNLPVEIDIANLQDEQNVSLTMHVHDGNVDFFDIITTIDGKKHEDTTRYSCEIGASTATPIGVIYTKKNNFISSSQHQTVYVKRIGYNKATKKLQDRLNFEIAGRQTDIINISYKDEISQRAENIINTIILVYNESWIRDKNALAISTSQFINERIKVIEEELGDVDSDISSFKSQNQMTDFAISNTQALNETSSSGKSIRTLTNELYMIRYIRNYLQQNLGTPQLLPTGLGLTNQSIAAQISNYNDQLLQRNNIASNSSDNSPLVKQIEEQLHSISQSIVKSLDNEEINLQQQIDSEKQNLDIYSAKISESPDLEKRLREVERQQNVKENLYLYLLQKREENELNQAFTAYNTRIVATPYGNTSPYAPQTSKILFFALFIGLLFPMGIVYVKINLNTKVRGRKDMENIVAPFVGEIPQYVSKHHKKNKFDTQIVIRDNGRSVIEEAFRVLRTNVEFILSKHDKCCKSIMLTSFNPGSGKTFISLNFAASLALKNKNVLIADLDFRKASLSKVIGNPRDGISNYIAGYSESCPVFSVNNNKNLFMAPVGIMPPNPTELLFDSRLNELFAKWRNEYDYIIIDCPPVEIIADADIISQWADMTLFVVRTGLLERNMLPDINKYYEGKKFNNLTILLNGTDYTHGHYSYYSKYNYGYYHSYNNAYTEK